MNTVADLVSELESKGVRFSPHTGALRVDAPQGTLTDHLRAILSERKPEIVAFLATKKLELAGELIHLFNERAWAWESDGTFTRDEAERRAMLEVRATPQFRQWQGNEF